MWDARIYVLPSYNNINNVILKAATGLHYNPFTKKINGKGLHNVHVNKFYNA